MGIMVYCEQGAPSWLLLSQWIPLPQKTEKTAAKFFTAMMFQQVARVNMGKARAECRWVPLHSSAFVLHFELLRPSPTGLGAHQKMRVLHRSAVVSWWLKTMQLQVGWLGWLGPFIGWSCSFVEQWFEILQNTILCSWNILVSFVEWFALVEKSHFLKRDQSTKIKREIDTSSKLASCFKRSNHTSEKISRPEPYTRFSGCFGTF